MKYRLLKDLPGVKAGAIYEHDSYLNCYRTRQYEGVNSASEFRALHIATVEDYTDWFEKVAE